MIKSPKRILSLLGFGTAVSLLGESTLYTVLPNPKIAGQLGISLAMVGILLGANRAIRLVLNGPLGILADKLPRRGMLIASLSLGLVANLCYVLGHGFWPIFLGRIVWGIAWAMLWIAGNALVLDISTDENRGKFSGRYQMWFAIGIASSSFLGGLLTDLLGFINTMWLTSGVIGATTLLWFFFLPETRQSRASTPKTADIDTEEHKIRTPWKSIFNIALPIFISRFISWGILSSTTILWLSSFIGDGLHIANIYVPLATLTGGFTAFTMLANIGSAPLAGFLSDKIGRRWPILGGSALLGAAGIGFMSSPWAPLALIGAFLAQITGSSTETLIPAIAGDRIDKTAQGRSLGIVYTFGDLGAMLGPPIALGLLNTGQFTIPRIYQISSILFLGIAIFSWMQSKRGTEKSANTQE